MKKILIINANYYKDITNKLVSSATNVLKKNNIKYKIIEAPGVFEIPYTIRKYIYRFDGFVVLGCVIKGETPHFDLITKSTFSTILNISILYKKPISNGIITCLNMKQAIQRSKISRYSRKKNKGIEAANALVALLKNEPKN